MVNDICMNTFVTWIRYTMSCRSIFFFNYIFFFLPEKKEKKDGKRIYLNTHPK